jgi:ribonuclease P protein component
VNFLIKTKPLGCDVKPVAVSVGKNVFKKASGRNLIKRRVRAILYPISKQEKKSFLVIVKSPVTGKTFGEIKEELIKQIPRR